MSKFLFKAEKAGEVFRATIEDIPDVVKAMECFELWKRVTLTDFRVMLPNLEGIEAKFTMTQIP